MRKSLMTVGLAASLVWVSAAPALADPPEVVDDYIFNIFLDLENGLVGFWNISRSDFCNWEAGGFAGPPPVEALVETMVRETGQGALVGSFNATRTLELWQLDEGSELIGPCEDTQGQSEPWATGAFRCISNDNDLDVSLNRTNSFGDRGNGTVYDAAGDAYHYSMTRRFQIDKNGDSHLRVENFNLKMIGN